MGGSTTGGNATAAAEFNIHADPEAAARVFDCGVPVAMFGLNVCRQVPIGQPQVERLRRPSAVPRRSVSPAMSTVTSPSAAGAGGRCSRCTTRRR
jgi:purine nucleosidase